MLSAIIGEKTEDLPPVPTGIYTDSQQWLLFVKRFLAAFNEPSVNQKGIFGFTPKRLLDLGIAKSVRLGNENGKSVWFIEWCDSEWLKDKDKQYATFCRSMRLYAESEIRFSIGSVFLGKPATLSGLIAIAHRCGPNWKKFLYDEAYRRKLGHGADNFTEILYRATNETF